VAPREHEFETGRQAEIEEREPLEPRAGLWGDIVDAGRVSGFSRTMAISSRQG
jgi:hypothetical protein